MGRPRRTVLLLSAGILLGALFGAACADDPTRPPVLGEGPAQPGGGGVVGSGEGGVVTRPDGGDAGDAGSCTDLPNTGAEVQQNAVVDDLVAGTGGTPVDGIYNLSEARLFQGPSGLPGPTGYIYQGSIRITGSVFERIVVLKSSGGATTETRSKGTFTQNGVNGTIAIACPSPAQEQVTYTAGADSLTLANLVTKESFVFTRQP